MILDATNQKQAINEYAKMGPNGFLGEKYFLKCFRVFLSFRQKKHNLVGWGCLWQYEETEILYLSFRGHKAA